MLLTRRRVRWARLRILGDGDHRNERSDYDREFIVFFIGVTLVLDDFALPSLSRWRFRVFWRLEPFVLRTTWSGIIRTANRLQAVEHGKLLAMLRLDRILVRTGCICLSLSKVLI